MSRRSIHRRTVLKGLGTALALPWLVGCGTSHQEKTPMPQSVPAQMSAEQAVSSPEPSSAQLQTATFALG